MALKFSNPKSFRLFTDLCNSNLKSMGLKLYRSLGLAHSRVPKDVQITMHMGGGIEPGDRTVTIEIRNTGSKTLFVENIEIVAPAPEARLCVYGRHRLGHRAPDTTSAALEVVKQTWIVPSGRAECKIFEVRAAANATAAEVEISLEYHHGDSGISARALHRVGPHDAS